jgi:hypothetical protein
MLSPPKHEIPFFSILLVLRIAEMPPIIFLPLVFAGCQAVAGETLGQNSDDTNLTAAVKAQLAREKCSTLTRIDVDTNRSVVSLNGNVESTEQRARAEQIARGVSGVKGVINNFQVQR